MTLREQFRESMRKFTYSVSVLSSNSKNNSQNAITVSSVTSISLDPPSILVAVNKESSIQNDLEKSSFFCINLLNESQKYIAKICSNPNTKEERFKKIEWIQDQAPVIKNSLASIICKADKVIEYNTHKIVIGSVSRVIDSGLKKTLMYQDGAYRAGFKQTL